MTRKRIFWDALLLGFLVFGTGTCLETVARLLQWPTWTYFLHDTLAGLVTGGLYFKFMSAAFWQSEADLGLLLGCKNCPQQQDCDHCEKLQGLVKQKEEELRQLGEFLVLKKRKTVPFV